MGELAPTAIYTAMRRSTKSRGAAGKLRRASAIGMAGLVLDLILFIAVGVLGGFFGDRFLRVAVIVSLGLIVPTVLFGIRRKLWKAADGALRPVFPREPRKQWPPIARAVGMSYAMAAAIGMLGVLLQVSLVIASAWMLVANGPVPGLVDTSLTTAIVIIGILACCWAYLTGRNDHLARLRDATPPQMARVHELHDHSRALEQALHETTKLSEELQVTIEAERKLIEDLVREAADAQHVTDLTNEQVEAITARMDRAQRRSTLRERWINVAIAAFSLAAGYALNLLTPNQLGQIFERH